MTPTIASVLEAIGVRRMAHFTPSKNLFHIIQDGEIRSSKELADRAPEYFDPTDMERFDRHPDMTCLSFTFPNGYYLDKARARPQFAHFPDWVCLMIDPRVLTRDAVLFCPCNAARGGGVYAAAGIQALQACFASPSLMGWPRGPHHHPQAATDIQAEALVPGPIPLSDVIAIVVPSAEAAGNEFARLDVTGLRPASFEWIVSPKMFDRDKLSSAIRAGGTIEESPWSQ